MIYLTEKQLKEKNLPNKIFQDDEGMLEIRRDGAVLIFEKDSCIKDKYCLIEISQASNFYSPEDLRQLERKLKTSDFNTILTALNINIAHN